MHVEAVSLIEVIEHIQPHQINHVVENVFGFMRPAFVAMTTPNRDFNRFFLTLRENGFRDDDHKFEFSQEEFEQFCRGVCHSYGYEVAFDATYFKGGFADIIRNSFSEAEIGRVPLSQIAFFRKKARDADEEKAALVDFKPDEK